MNILDIYKAFIIPPNLMRHQLEVATVGRFICDHWRGKPVDKELITKSLLLHDMGNIIKFKRPFFGELEKDSAYWEQIQEKFVSRYGTDVHTATLAIIAKIGGQEDCKSLVDEMRSVWTDKSPRVFSGEARICEYADCTVTPKGIEGFATRITDLMKRYYNSEVSEHILLARKNAEMITPNVDMDLTSLSKIDFSRQIEDLKKFVVSGAGFDPATATL